MLQKILVQFALYVHVLLMMRYLLDYVNVVFRGYQQLDDHYVHCQLELDVHANEPERIISFDQ